MTKWYQKDSFLALRKKWYAKLASDGFVDTETIDWSTGDAHILTPKHVVTGAKILRGYGDSWTLVRDFYEAARAHIHVIETELSHDHDMVEAFKLFADEGMSFRAIQRKLKPELHPDSSIFRSAVSKFVKSQVSRFWGKSE